MKRNLKNYPYGLSTKIGWQQKDEWAKELEAELHDAISKLKNLKIKDNPDCPMIISKYLNEVLGVEGEA